MSHLGVMLFAPHLKLCFCFALIALLFFAEAFVCLFYHDGIHLQHESQCCKVQEGFTYMYLSIIIYLLAR